MIPVAGSGLIIHRIHLYIKYHLQNHFQAKITQKVDIMLFKRPSFIHSIIYLASTGQVVWMYKLALKTRFRRMQEAFTITVLLGT